MDAEQINAVKSQMADVMDDFLDTISNKLIGHYKKDLSSVYLHKMVDHLKTFFDDITCELEEKSASLRLQIEDLRKEARDLKRALNVDFEFCTNDKDDFPLTEYFDKLDSDLYEMRELYIKRKLNVEKCLEQQRELCAALGQPERKLQLDPLPTESEVQDFELYLVDLKGEKLQRENDIGNLKKEIGSLCVELELTICESALKEYLPTSVNLEYLNEELSILQKRRETIQRECNEMLDKLEILWECLDVPQPSRNKFRHMGEVARQTSLDLIAGELKRCKIIKQENVKLFVEKLREQLVEWWDKIKKSDAERARFTYFNSQVYTEDLLDLHEMELADTKKFYEENRIIFDKLDEYSEWLEKMIALEAKQNEPNRYNNRGGQLLREERERKQILLKVPEIKKEIRKMLDEYEHAYRRPFLINGECVRDIMARDWDNMNSAKEQLKSARKANIATPSHRTPKTPMSIKGQTSAMKRLASTTNLALANGNTAKKLFTELPGSGRGNNLTSSARHVNVTAIRTPGSVGNHTKRNLLTQLNSPGLFAKPKVSRVKPCKVATTLSVPRRRSNGMMSASKILKKYRRSSNKRLASISYTDESVLNYDTFENRIKTSEYTINSSVVEIKENQKQNTIAASSKISNSHIVCGTQARSILRTPNRSNVNVTRGHLQSPHLGSKKLKATNMGLLI